MSQFVLPFPKIADPGYGTVGELCATLGYPQTLEHGRKGSKLANAVLRYRKRIAASNPDLPQCPLDSETPEALMYATGFLEENKEYFEPSETAEELGWPIYPIHEEKIISGLKKLICLQEYFWRRNQNYFQKRDWDQENNIGTSSTLNAPEDAGNSSTPKTIAKPKREADAGVEEHVLENIAVHLEYAYPLEGFPSISTTWLFEPLKFSYGKINPKLVDPFVIRYLHERNLYNTDDAAAIDQFARDAMKQYPHLAHQTEYESWARDRCQLIIQKFADSWMEWERNGYGFLKEVNKRFQKSPAFEKAWALRRVEWLNKVHHGSSQKVIEWCDAGLLSQVTEKSTKKTRSPNLKRGFTAVNHSSHKKSTPSKKRSRLDLRLSESMPKTGSGHQDDEEQLNGSPNTIFVKNDHNNGTPSNQSQQPADRTSPPASDYVNSLVDIATSSYEAQSQPVKDAQPSQPTPPASSTRATMGFTPVNSKFSPHQPPGVPAPFVLKSSTLNPQNGPPPPHAPQQPHAPTPGPVAQTPLPYTGVANPSPYAAINPSSYAASNPSPYAAAMHPAQYSYAQNPSPYAAVHATPYAPPSTYFPPANAHPQPPPQRSAPPAPEARPQPPQAVAPSIESYHEVPVAPPPAVNVPSTVPDKFLSPSPEKESLPTINNHGLPNNTKVQDRHASNSYHTNGMPSPAFTSDQHHHHHYISEHQHTPQASHGRNSFQSVSGDRNGGTPHRLSTSADFKRESIGTPIESKRPTLKFAIQDDSGVPDDEPENMFTKKQLWDMDVAALFATVAQKSGKSFDELSLLTFRCQWEPASIIISKYAGDDAWKRQKKKLNSLFISAQSEFPDELSFEVWVFCGDRLSKKIKKQDAEDDVD